MYKQRCFVRFYNFLNAGDFIYYKVLKDKILPPRYLFAGCYAARQGGELRVASHRHPGLLATRPRLLPGVYGTAKLRFGCLYTSPFGIPHSAYYSRLKQDFMI